MGCMKTEMGGDAEFRVLSPPSGYAARIGTDRGRSRSLGSVSESGGGIQIPGRDRGGRPGSTPVRNRQSAQRCRRVRPTQGRLSRRLILAGLPLAGSVRLFGKNGANRWQAGASSRVGADRKKTRPAHNTRSRAADKGPRNSWAESALPGRPTSEMRYPGGVPQVL